MKTNYLLIALLACAALVGCNKEGDEAPNGNSRHYMGFHISMPEVSTKASGTLSGGYTNGTAAEQAINSIYFYFYKDGAYITYGKGEVATQFSPDPQTTGGNVENIWGKAGGKGVVVIESSMNTKPNQFLCVINSPKPLFFRNLPLASAVKALQTGAVAGASAVTSSVTGSEDYAEIGFAKLESSTPYFCMANSPKIEAGKAVYAVPITGSDIKDSEDAASNAPVEVYVERMASKVEVMNLTGATNDLAATWDITLDAWGLNGVSLNSFVVKNVDPAWVGNPAFTGWLSNSDGRINWAQDPHYLSADGAFDNTSYYPASAEVYYSAKTTSKLLYYSENDIKESANPSSSVYKQLRKNYCLENTFSANGQNDARIVGTVMMVLATVKPAGGAVRDLYEYHGVMYNFDDYAAHLLSSAQTNYSFFVNDGGSYRAINKGDLQLYKAVKAADYATSGKFKTISDSEYSDGYVTLYPKVSLFEFDGANYVTADDAHVQQAFLKDIVDLANAYKGGQMWYAIPVEHLGKGSGVGGLLEGNYGVVRNNYYQITLGNITTLGHGIYDPAEPIVPGEKTTKWYMGAKINVNAWNIVKQTSNLSE